LFQIIQKPGELVVVFAMAYHEVMNLGYNLAEAFNFATEQWFPFGLRHMSCQHKFDGNDIDPVTGQPTLVGKPQIPRIRFAREFFKEDLMYQRYLTGNVLATNEITQEEERYPRPSLKELEADVAASKDNDEVPCKHVIAVIKLWKAYHKEKVRETLVIG
jgi:hypothetical protein